ncbi:MAG: hypothetical protein AVDCRST_MAG56-2612 [uncultured Cytophagales bacterium]|uniref:DUF4276 family protein n=1 Tax=uncultured Cytophagales bacterium TaxID=158755 RepID=A0A6J4IZ57_9SPHI|nr:MAG: hypothetical protein AVDCRST_MAG56-2612 [uncultured Cytophagales bacterium]
MRQITYGFVGEDVAQRIFLDNYLQQLPAYLNKTEVIVFTPNQGFHYEYKLHDNNKDSVDNLFVEAGRIGFLQYRLDLYFVGRDCDHYNPADQAVLRREMESKVDTRWQDKTIIFVPVQCIEHWLWYLKWNCDNPGITKNELLENKSNFLAKEAVYGRRKTTTKRSEPIVKDLTEHIPIDWLCSRSESFRAFHQKTVASVTQLLA